MTIKYKIIDRQVSLHFYEDDSNYYKQGSCQLFLYGDYALMHSIQGDGFIPACYEHLKEIMDTLKINTVEGYMSPAIARTVRMVFRTHPDFVVTLGEKKEIFQNEEDTTPAKLFWVKVSLKNTIQQ